MDQNHKNINLLRVVKNILKIMPINVKKSMFDYINTQASGQKTPYKEENNDHKTRKKNYKSTRW